MHYVLGRQIQTTWKDNIFAGIMKNSDFEIHSSEYQRTILSAESHAYGLFPPGSGLKVTNLDKDPKIALPSYKDINIDVTALGQNALPSGYRPIPVAVSLVTNDNLFMKGMKFNCKAAEDKLEATSKKAFADNKALLDWFKPTLEKSDYNKFVGDAFKDLGGTWNTQTIGIFSDINKCYQYYANQPMPGTEAIFPWMKYIFGVYYYFENFPDPQITKLITTNMAKRILEKMEAQMNPTAKKIKYLGLSGHEFNIFPFMMGYDLMSLECMKKNALEQDQQKWDTKCKGSPEFAANVVWELSKKKKVTQPGRRMLQDSSDFFVRVFYDGEPIDVCKGSATPEKYCKYEDFKKHFTSKFILSDDEYKLTCTGSAAPQLSVPATTSVSPAWMWVDFALIGVILILSALVIFRLFS